MKPVHRIHRPYRIPGATDWHASGGDDAGRGRDAGGPGDDPSASARGGGGHHTGKLLTETLRILHASLMRDFGLAAPRILVAGLNPHAGEGGHLGREEIEVIEPVLKQCLRGGGMNLVGPLPADTLFQRKNLAAADAVLAMYHDQGLPVLKHASFGEGVNITLGLPIIRTSVDHGTALDLAGGGRIDPGSLQVAIDTAWVMADYRRAACTMSTSPSASRPRRRWASTFWSTSHYISASSRRSGPRRATAWWRLAPVPAH
jgi:hypothetical protein